MATKYCDHGLYAAPVAAGTVPTVAEDGNGAGKTAATMATLVITFTGIPAADGAITVAGITFTAKASGATGNQFNAVTDAATCATNFKNAINASTTNAIKPTGAIAATAPLRNVVNATSSAGVVTIYTRCAGSEWNSVTETITLTNATITAQWAGGADGAWGYFFNPSAIAFPTSQAARAYGVFSDARPYVGGLVAGDKIIVRSAKTINDSNNSDITCASLSIGTKAAPIRIVIDDGTEWPADGSTPVFTINWTYSSNRRFGDATGNRYYVLAAKKYSETSFGFYLNCINSGGSVGLIVAQSRELVGCFINSAAALKISNGSVYAAADADMALIRESKLQTPANLTFDYPTGSSTYGWSLSLSEVEFSNLGNTVSNAALFQSGATQATRINLYLDSCKFTNFIGGSIGSAITTGSFQCYFRNCDFGNIGILGPVSMSGVNSVCASSSQFGSRDFFINTIFGFVEWTSNRSMPTCNARLLDGTTPWAIHVIPTTTAGNNSRFQWVETPRISKINSLASGVRTLTVELAIHDALSWNKSHICAVIDYIDTSGVRQVVDGYDFDGGALTTSTATWSAETAGKVTYVDNSLTQSHNKYKFSITTPTAIEAGTDIGFVIRVHSTVAASTYGVFVDPEIQVA